MKQKSLGNVDLDCVDTCARGTQDGFGEPFAYPSQVEAIQCLGGNLA